MHVDLMMKTENGAGRILLAPPSVTPTREVDVVINEIDAHMSLLLDANDRVVALEVPNVAVMLPKAFVTDSEFDVQVDDDVDEVYVTFGPLAGFIEFTHPCVFPGQRGMINLDFDPRHRLIGLEVVDASSVLHSVREET